MLAGEDSSSGIASIPTRELIAMCIGPRWTNRAMQRSMMMTTLACCSVCCSISVIARARPARRHPRMLAWWASQGQSSAIHNSDVLLTIVTSAAREGGFEASQAIRVIAGLVEQLEMSGESRTQDVDALISIGATLWTQHQKLLQCG